MSMYDGDPFDNGTPKYNSATEIYDALRNMASGEEIGIMANMFADVSWEGQDYYYTDNADKLTVRWDEATNYGDRMWLMDVAVWQLSNEDVSDWIYEMLGNDDLAKRAGFKKVFIENVLNGIPSQYKEVSETFESELSELDRFDFFANTNALSAALPEVAYDSICCRYNKLCSTLYDKLKGLRLDAERQLVVESRAMLTGYDDFMFGLRSNQTLYEAQEKMYQNKAALLQQKYDAAVQKLLSIAREQGVMLQLPDAPLLLATSDVSGEKSLLDTHNIEK